MPTLHPRHVPYTKASNAITQAILAAIKEYDLSSLEVVAILLENARHWNGYLLRDERAE